MALFATSLNDLGRRVAQEHGGRFAAVPDAAESSAVALVDRLATWDSFADTSRYHGLEVPFLKRAQIVAADLARSGVAAFHDLDLGRRCSPTTWCPTSCEWTPSSPTTTDSWNSVPTGAKS